MYGILDRKIYLFRLLVEAKCFYIRFSLIYDLLCIVIHHFDEILFIYEVIRTAKVV